MINSITAFDTHINTLMPLLHNPISNTFFIFITSIFSPSFFFFWFIPLLIFLIYKKNYFATAFLFFGIAGGQVVKNIMKEIINRPRPENPFGLISDSSSFPSGHSILSVFFFMAIYYLFTPYINIKWRKLVQSLLIFAIFLILFSRLFVQMHYLSDVVVGLIIGILSFIFTVFIFAKFKFKKYI